MQTRSKGRRPSNGHTKLEGSAKFKWTEIAGKVEVVDNKAGWICRANNIASCASPKAESRHDPSVDAHFPQNSTRDRVALPPPLLFQGTIVKCL